MVVDLPASGHVRQHHWSCSCQPVDGFPVDDPTDIGDEVAQHPLQDELVLFAQGDKFRQQAERNALHHSFAGWVKAWMSLSFGMLRWV